VSPAAAATSALLGLGLAVWLGMAIRVGALPRSRCRRIGRVIRVDPEAFEQMVGTALDSLPAEFASLMTNVAVLVEHGPGPRGLLGLYEGIPLTRRTATSYAGVLPDRITIYQQAICAICSTDAQVIEQVRRTVIHEVGHYVGISDERLGELGW
jgi:predicted Zn-dependent protease with MMP-like domain